MKFTLDHKDLFSHLVLHDLDYASKVSCTELWKENQTLEIKILINGVNCPPQALDKLLAKMWEQANTESGKQDLKLEVETKAKELLQSKANTLYELLGDIQNKLEDVNNLLPYDWEK